MPQTTFQKIFFMSLTVLLSVTAFTIYNVALSMGSMSNRVFLIAIREIPLTFTIALLLEALFFFRIAERLAFRFVDPARDRPLVIILAITSMTICLMCPAMSLSATLIYDGFNSEIIANWLQKIAFNFPFAFFIQIFVIGPFVRLIFRTIFKPESEKSESFV